jgi:hypothetical protein
VHCGSVTRRSQLWFSLSARAPRASLRCSVAVSFSVYFGDPNRRMHGCSVGTMSARSGGSVTRVLAASQARLCPRRASASLIKVGGSRSRPGSVNISFRSWPAASRPESVRSVRHRPSKRSPFERCVFAQQLWRAARSASELSQHHRNPQRARLSCHVFATIPDFQTQRRYLRQLHHARSPRHLVFGQR